MNAASRPREELRFQGAACEACGRVLPKEELDEDGWCTSCRPRMKRRLRLWRHVIAAIIVVPFAIWVLRVEKLDFLHPLAWLLPLAAAYYLGLRIGREVLVGWVRWRRGL